MKVSLIQSPNGSAFLEYDLVHLEGQTIETATTLWGFYVSNNCLCIPASTYYVILIGIDEPGEKFFVGIAIDGRSVFTSRTIVPENAAGNLADEAGYVEIQEGSNREFPIWHFWEPGLTAGALFLARREIPDPSCFPEPGIIRVNLYSARKADFTALEGANPDRVATSTKNVLETPDWQPGELISEQVISYRVI